MRKVNIMQRARQIWGSGSFPETPFRGRDALVARTEYSVGRAAVPWEACQVKLFFFFLIFLNPILVFYVNQIGSPSIVLLIFMLRQRSYV